MSVYDLPAIYTSMNAVSTVFIIGGLLLIKMGKKRGHAACMGVALLSSTAFLICYLFYHYNVGSVKFTYHEPFIRGVYFTLLLTHIILAIFILPLVILTVVPALRQRFEKHKAIARWTAPIWLYVSATGVVIYLMLYQWFRSAEIPG